MIRIGVSNKRVRGDGFTRWSFTRIVRGCTYHGSVFYDCDDDRSEVARKIRWERIMMRGAVGQQLQALRDAREWP